MKLVQSSPGRGRRTRAALVGSLITVMASSGALVASGAAAEPAASTAVPATPAPAFAAAFEKPSQEFQPKTRVWWACGNITTGEIQTQFQYVKDAGFSGVEIICFSSLPQFGWGSAAMNARMQDALTIGENLGLTVDWTVSGSWPLNVPGVGANDLAAAKEMVQGRALVVGGQTYTGPVPEPSSPPAGGATEKELIAVQAVRCEALCAETGTVKLVPGSLVDLTDEVDNGLLTWTAPAEGTWAVISSWQRGTGQLSVVFGFNNVTPGVVTDHFSRAGADAGINYWNKNVLTPQMRAGLQKVGGDIFEDSLELNSKFHWTPELLEEFKERRGYDLRPYLSILVIPDIHKQYAETPISNPANYSFSPAEDARVRRDYYDTLTELYREKHMAPIREFANGLGMNYRAQAYGTTTDFSALSLDMDVVEGEGLAANLDASPLNRVDEYYRNQTASVSLTDKDVMSSECCAIGSSAYAVPWEDQIGRFNGAYVGGVNQIVLHGVAQQNANGQKWPGYSPFTSQGGNGYSDAHGPRMPSWGDVPKITEWMGRMQYALRTGQEKVDVAVFRDIIGHGHADVTDLSADGYTYEYLSPAHLGLDSVFVRNGVLAPDASGYRALVLAGQPTLRVQDANRILGYAKAGLPVVIVGDLPATTPGRDGKDAELQTVLTALAAQPTVARVATQAGLDDALAALGADAATSPAVESRIMTAHRKVNEGDLYMAFNPTKAPISRVFTFEGTGTPAVLNAWTGEVTPVAAYREVDGGVQTRVTLKPGESVLYGVGSFTKPLAVHVVDLLDGVSADNADNLYIDGSSAGTYSAKLSNGSDATADITQVANSVNLTAWDLTVEDWHRNATGDLEKSTSSHQLNGLKPWSQISGLEDTSGIGTYRTTLDLPQTWTGGRTAVLNLGTVTDTFDVTVNGTHVDGIDQTTATVDVTRYLQHGENTIEVRVATMLRNRLRVTTGFPGQAAQARQDYGLIGPVTLQPYGRVRLWPRTQEPATPGGPVTATSAPAVSGIPELGRTLTATTGAWNQAGLTYAYQWLRDGQGIAGQTGTTLELTKADIGTRISVQVTATTGTGGSAKSGSATSTPTATVHKAAAAVKLRTVKKAKKGKAVAVRIRVTSPSATPTGRVVVRLNGKKFRTASVQDGRAITLKVTFRTAGRSILRATYKGSGVVQKARSARAVVRVR